MKTEIQIFTREVFGEIRTCQVNNQIMFVGKDVAQALGYSNTRDALRKHVESEDKGTVAIRDTAYETRVTLINESGLCDKGQVVTRDRYLSHSLIALRPRGEGLFVWHSVK